MSKFEFLAGFVSILIAIGITDMLYSLHRLLKNRSQIRWSFSSLAFTLHTFLLLLSWWFSQVHNFESQNTNTGLGFFIFLIPLFALLLMALSVLPDKEPEDEFDLEIWYMTTKKYFLIIHLVYIVATVTVLFLRDAGFTIYIANLILFGMISSLLISKNRIYHIVMNVILLACDILILSQQTTGFN